MTHRPRVAEFFAGIGLVRLGMERAGFDVVFANDIDVTKFRLYRENFGTEHFLLGDIAQIHGDEVPDVDVATASFPCTDLSLAGNRAGLKGSQSSLFWEFARILDEMGARRPPVIMLENVVGLATSHGGSDMRKVVEGLNRLGYTCDIFVADAVWFVPQSRPRLFIVGTLEPVSHPAAWEPSAVRPSSVVAFVRGHPELKLLAAPLGKPSSAQRSLDEVVEKLPPTHERWWEATRMERFVTSLSPIQRARLTQMTGAPRILWATAYRRTRGGHAVWEIRRDAISGCLRTARGGSSRQALVEAGQGGLRIRWMGAAEYARLQGAPGFRVSGVSENQALFGFGDAVCVPVITWIAEEYLRPLLTRSPVVGAMRTLVPVNA